MFNKLKIEFHGSGWNGWIGFCIFNNKKQLNAISISGVYNPFGEYIEILEKLKKGSRKKLILEIDQEGYYGILEFKSNGKNIVFQTKTDVSERTRKKYNMFNDSKKIIFNKKQVINEMKTQLKKQYIKNYKIMNNEDYYLGFNLKRLEKI